MTEPLCSAIEPGERDVICQRDWRHSGLHLGYRPEPDGSVTTIEWGDLWMARKLPEKVEEEIQ